MITILHDQIIIETYWALMDVMKNSYLLYSYYNNYYSYSYNFEKFAMQLVGIFIWLSYIMNIITVTESIVKGVTCSLHSCSM